MTRNPLHNLVLFMVCLSIAGSVVAGVQYLAVDLPQQNAVPHVPSNSGSLQEQDINPDDNLQELLINDNDLQEL